VSVLLSGLASAVALCLVVVGCTEDTSPPLPTGVEVAEALRAASLPLYAVADGVNFGVDGGCLDRDARLPCAHRTAFLDERSHIDPGEDGSAIVDRPFHGGFVEIYPDADTARLRAETLADTFKASQNHDELTHAIFSAGPIVLSLGVGLLGYAAPYTGDDYRQTLDDRYGPITFACARGDLLPTPVVPPVTPPPTPTPTATPAS
jgi:hypothetical protein